jgi:hypothetical protein
MSTYSISKVLAVLSVVWAGRQVFLAVELQGGTIVTTFFLLWALLWLLLAFFLWRGRFTVWVALVLTAMCAAELLLLNMWAEYAIMLVGWLALSLLITPRGQLDQLFVARVLLSTVYAFGALSKLQPSWMAGDNLYYLAATRPQAAWIEPFLVQPWLPIAAAAVAASELWLAIGLWFPRTRLLTAIMGIVLHVTLTVMATVGGMNGLLHLVALNGGLVLLYPAFWHELQLPGPRESRVRIAMD